MNKENWGDIKKLGKGRERAHGKGQAFSHGERGWREARWYSFTGPVSKGSVERYAEEMQEGKE